MNKAPVLMLGARSDIGMAIAHRFAREGYPVQLAARAADTLETDRADIERLYSIKASVHEFDALDTTSHAGFLDGLSELPTIAICAVGLMGDQAESEKDMDAAVLVMRSNFEGPASIMSELANRFESRGSGVLVGISSVAGDRGRATNYVYGSAKAGFTAFLSGLRNRLAKHDVHVMTVLPGFVATKMTQDMDLPKKLTADPKEVADYIFKAVRRKKNVIYYRHIWFCIMMIIRSIPESIFKKLKL